MNQQGADWPAIVQAFASVVSAGLAFVIWRVYVGQLHAMRTQSTHMENGLAETRKAADAAKDAATIALAQKRIGDRQLEHTKALNRQWVNIRKYRFAIEPDGPCFRFEMKNSTARPFTITRIIVLSSIAGDGINSMGMDRLLTPQEIYPEAFELTRADAAGLFATGERTTFDVVGAVYFIDGLGDPQRQLFGRHIVRQSTGEILITPHAGGLSARWRSLLGLHPDVIATGD